MPAARGRARMRAEIVQSEQQPHAEMDRMAAAGLQAVSQFLIGKAGGLGRGELHAGENGGANGQRPAVAGLSQQALGLRVAGQQFADKGAPRRAAARIPHIGPVRAGSAGRW